MIPANAIRYFKRLAEMHGGYVKTGEAMDPDDGSVRPVIYIYGEDAASLRRALKEDIRRWWMDKPDRDFGVLILSKRWDTEESW